MKSIYLFTGLAFLSMVSLSQQVELDSLLNEVRKHPERDSIRLNLLLDIAFDYSSINPDKGLQTADTAISLAIQLKDQLRLGSAYNYKGVNYDAKGEYRLALECYNRCLEIRRQERDTLRMARTFHNIGIVYFNLSDYQQSLRYHQQSLDIFEKLQYHPGIASALNSIGVVFLSLADYTRALEHYFRALKLFEYTKDRHNMASAFLNIGLVYNHTADYKKALEYEMKALAIFRESGNQQNIVWILGNIGNTYDGAGDPLKSLDYYRESLNIADSLGFTTGIASNYSNMGTVYAKLKKYPEALENLGRAVHLYKSLGDRNNLGGTLNQIGNVYLEAPSTALKGSRPLTGDRTSVALRYFKEALENAEAAGALDTQGDIWEGLSKAYEGQKQYDKSLEAYKQFIVLRDSIMNSRKKQEIDRLEMQFEFDKKEALLKASHEKDSELAALRINRQRAIKNTFIAAAGVILLAALTSFMFYKRRRDAEDQKMEAEFKARVADTEMKALRLQMNPHFIFNSLNSISDYISKHDIVTADFYLTKFAKLMRIILENSDQKEVTLADDLKALELYMQLERLRLNNKFSYEIRVDESIDQEAALVPPLILQPFVENSIWHGISKKQGEGKIVIDIRREEKMLNCIVEDNGVGMERSSRNELIDNQKRSLGVKITKARIDIINRRKKANAGVELIGTGEGTKVEVKLPIELNF